MKKPKKVPPDTPERGDRVRLRGDQLGRAGTLKKYDPETQWATVEWDNNIVAPKICHRFELVRVR